MNKLRLRNLGKKRVPTNDNWCGTYPDGTVTGHIMILSTDELRIAFWGNDDMGYELDMPYTDGDFEYWNHWLTNLSFISIKTLFDLGFKPA